MQLFLQITCLCIILVLGFVTLKKYPLKMDVHTMTEIAFLLVLAFVLSYFSLMLGLFGFPSLKIGFALVPLILIGLLYGPQYGFVAGIVYDVVGLIITPTDAPFLGFTLTNILSSTLPGYVSKMNVMRNPKTVRQIVVGVTSVLSVVLIGAIWMMGESFPVELSSGQRIGVTVLAAIYPLLIGVGLRIIMKQHEDIDVKVLIAVLIVEGGVNMFLNPLWLYALYNIPYLASFFVRSVKLLIMIPLDGILLATLYRIGKRLIRRKNESA